MFVLNQNDAESRERDGLISRFLLGKVDVPDAPMTVTWVTVEPGKRQPLHHHAPTQVYIIIQGGGLMHVGGETQQVHTGDLIYIPSGAEHGIENNTTEILAYVSAATPAFDLRQAYDRGQLTSNAYGKSD